MKTVRMTYKGVALDVNPQSVTATYSKNTQKKTVPFSFSKTTVTAENPTTIQGEGYLLNTDAYDAKTGAAQLMELYKQEGAGYLFIPELPPVKAYFTALQLACDTEISGIRFAFTFTEDVTCKAGMRRFGYTFAQRGETLFDIANRTGVDTKALFDANDYADMFSVEDGDKVWLQ